MMLKVALAIAAANLVILLFTLVERGRLTPLLHRLRTELDNLKRTLDRLDPDQQPATGRDLPPLGPAALDRPGMTEGKSRYPQEPAV
jgi:hypothetical protein